MKPEQLEEVARIFAQRGLDKFCKKNAVLIARLQAYGFIVTRWGFVL